MGLETIGTGIKTRLQTISALKRVYAPNETPESINEWPVAVITHDSTPAALTMGSNHWLHRFTVMLLVTDQDSASAFDKLIPFKEGTGTSSVEAALRGDVTLGGVASAVINIEKGEDSILSYGGQQYLGTTFDFEVVE